jgi:V-type H+-transporting ATPase subunit C
MSFWLVAVPNEGGRNSAKQWDALTAETVGRGLCEANAFKVPARAMKVGTLDSLMALSDDLVKIDTFIENVAKKAEKTVIDLVDKDNSSPLFIERDRSTFFCRWNPPF